MNNDDIPHTIDAAVNRVMEFDVLNPLMNPEIKELMSSEDNFIVTLHHGLGRWIRNEWGLWGGGPLQDEFKSLGIGHADDMSSIIIQLVYRRYKKLDEDVNGLVKYYREYWIGQGVNPLTLEKN